MEIPNINLKKDRKMKRKELYNIAESLATVRQSGKTFTLVIADNKKRLNDVIVLMEKEKEPTAEFKQYMKEAEELKRQFANKDHIGRVIMKPGSHPDGKRGMFYDIVGSGDPESDFRKALVALEIKHKDAILIQEEKERSFWEVYLEAELETEFEFRKIKYSEVPKEISQDQMDACLFLVNYDTNAKGDVR